MHLSGVRPAICLSQHGPTAAKPLLQVCCCGPSRQEISISCCTAGVRRPNAGSATLSAYILAERRLVCLRDRRVPSATASCH